MKVVVVTGPMGSGKSEVLAILKKKGFYTVKADQLSRSFLLPQSPCFDDLRNLFKNLAPSKETGFCPKDIAGEVFFNTPEKLKKLEDILHPLVKRKLDGLLSERKAEKEPFVFYEMPLLRRSHLLKTRFDCIILLVRPQAATLKSLVKTGWSQKEIKARLQQQTREPLF